MTGSHKHLKLDPCPRSHGGKHCFHVQERRNPRYEEQLITMTCCHCQNAVIAKPSVFTVTKREK